MKPGRGARMALSEIRNSAVCGTRKLSVAANQKVVAGVIGPRPHARSRVTRVLWLVTNDFRRRLHHLELGAHLLDLRSLLF
jgi:hypothetical protein